MIIKYSKIENEHFDWTDLGQRLVDGGLLKKKPSSQFDVPEFVSFIKKEEHPLFKVPSYALPAKYTHSYGNLPLDLYHHPYYLSLLNLRVRLKKLLKNDVSTKLKLSIMEVDLRIRELERDLNVKWNEELIPNQRSRMKSPFVFTEFLFDDDSFKIHDENFLFETDKEKSLSLNFTPYTLNNISDILSIIKRKSISDRMMDPLVWGLTYNKMFYNGVSFVGSFRKFIDIAYLNCRQTRLLEISSLFKAVQRHYQQILIFRKKYFHRRMLPFTEFRLGSLAFKCGYPEKVSIKQQAQNLYSTFFVTSWRSSSVALSNREYILSPTTIVPEVYIAKIDPLNFKPVETRSSKRYRRLPNFDYTTETEGTATFELGIYNLMFTIQLTGKTFHDLSSYWEFPNRLSPYFTKNPRNNRRNRPLDTLLGDEIRDVRRGVFLFLKKRIFKGPIYVTHYSKLSLKSLALKFLNFDTRHHERIRPINSPYTSKQRRLHRTLVTQGVIFEYWDEESQFLMPGQYAQLQLHNLEIELEMTKHKRIRKVKNFTISSTVAPQPVYEPEDIVEDTSDDNEEPQEQPEDIILEPDNFDTTISYELKGRFKFYYKCAYLWTRLRPYLQPMMYKQFFRRRFLIFRKLYIFAVKMPRTYLKALLYENPLMMIDSPTVTRFQILLAIWNSSYAYEDSMYDINDYVNSKDLSMWPDRFNDYVPDLDADDDHFEDFNENRNVSWILHHNDSLSGLFDTVDDILDEILDFLLVTVPHHLWLIFGSIINTVIRYPIWAFIESMTLLYAQLKLDMLIWYDNFLTVDGGKSKLLRRLVILARWLTKTFLLIVYIFSWLVYLDYNDLQILIVYTFDVPFHEFYYTVYVLLVVVSGFYLFGHTSFKEFIRDELGWENLLFLTTCSGSILVQDYEISPRPFKITEELYSHSMVTQRNKWGYKPVWSAPKKGFYQGLEVESGVLSKTGDQPLSGIAFNNVEHLVENQVWLDTPRHRDKSKWRQRLKDQKHIKSQYGRRRFSRDYDRDRKYAYDLISPDGHLNKRYFKKTKTPLSWYNRHNIPISNIYGNQDQKIPVILDDTSKKLKSLKRPYHNYGRPGSNDAQSSRYQSSADPALFSSYVDDE
jgi:hypothetical protein